MLLELNEGTAARRRVPFQVFASDGTSPDTGAAGDALILGVNSAGTITLAATATAVHAANGMYYVELSQSNLSVLGVHMLYHTVGNFPQHVATLEVVNSNPYSTLSGLLQTGYQIATGDYSSTVTFGAGTFKPGTYSTVSFAASQLGSNLDKTNYTITAGDYGSTVTVGVSQIAAKTYSGVSILGLTNYSNLSGNISNLTVRVQPMAYSGLTVETNNIAPNTYSGVTVGINNAVGDVSSQFTVGAKLTAASFAAGTVDAAALATDAVNEIADGVLDRNMATGTDSGTSAVRTARNALRILRNRVNSDATQIYAYKEDDTTIAWTASIATTGNSVFVTGADPNG